MKKGEWGISPPLHRSRCSRRCAFSSCAASMQGRRPRSRRRRRAAVGEGAREGQVKPSLARARARTPLIYYPSSDTPDKSVSVPESEKRLGRARVSLDKSGLQGVPARGPGQGPLYRLEPAPGHPWQSAWQRHSLRARCQGQSRVKGSAVQATCWCQVFSGFAPRRRSWVFF